MIIAVVVYPPNPPEESQQAEFNELSALDGDLEQDT